MGTKVVRETTEWHFQPGSIFYFLNISHGRVTFVVAFAVSCQEVISHSKLSGEVYIQQAVLPSKLIWLCF